MQVVIKRPVKLRGKFYAKSLSIQELPDNLIDDWYVKAMIQDGHIEKIEAKVEAEAPAKVEVKAKKTGAKK